MSDPNRSHDSRSDEDLLAKAIPIDQLEDEPDEPDELEPVESEEDDEQRRARARAKIQSFDTRVPHEDHWKRQPNVTGRGAIHVKTFVAKLRLDAIEHMDNQINEWLDNHPEYEVKYVTTSVGQLVGKTSEDAIFVNVWV